MGRKIPAKKHRGVKDPILQQVKRLERFVFNNANDLCGTLDCY